MKTKVNGQKFITTDQLCQRWGACSRMTVERKLANDATFPRPYRITRFRMWDVAEIEKYERDAALRRELPARQASRAAR